jgi:hypothetical protein
MCSIKNYNIGQFHIGHFFHANSNSKKGWISVENHMAAKKGFKFDLKDTSYKTVGVREHLLKPGPGGSDPKYLKIT